LKILDWYILKRYLVTFLFTLLILIPIAVAIDIAEKIDKFLRNDDLTFLEVVNDYYINFIIYYANTFMPLALFIAVIIFTSRLANNTEVIAINSSQISFTRFLYPYFIGATLITVVALLMNHYVVPNSSKTRKKFEYTYLKRNKKGEKIIKDFSLQLNDSTYIFIKSFDLVKNKGYHFTLDTYDGYKLKKRFLSNNIKWNEKDSTFSVSNWNERRILSHKDSLLSGKKLDTTFSFTPKDLNYQSTLAQEMPSDELSDFIEVSKKRGVKNLNVYLVELYKRTSLPIASYILTLIAVVLAHRKRRGGMGVNLALGISMMFIYVFFLKVGEVLGGVAGANSLLNVWIPNIVFGVIGVFLYLRAIK